MSEREPAMSIAESLVNLFLSLAALFLEPRVACDLWRWFVLPLGAPALSYWQALGIALLVAMWTRTNGVERNEKKTVAENVSMILFAWGIGWLIRGFA
jgi:hypothetical protein